MCAKMPLPGLNSQQLAAASVARHRSALLVIPQLALPDAETRPQATRVVPKGETRAHFATSLRHSDGSNPPATCVRTDALVQRRYSLRVALAEQSRNAL
jgi:hypothetical protein